MLIFILSGAFVFGEENQKDAVLVIKGDRAFLPASFIAERFGRTVEWNGITGEIIIK